MRSVAEIQQLDDTFWNRNSALADRMDNDYDFWRVKPYILDKWSDNVTDTDQRAFANAVIHTLTGSKLQIIVRRDDKNPEAESLMEKAFFGWLRIVDEKLSERLYPPLQNTLAFLSCIRGFINGRVLFYDGMPDILPYDARYHSYGLDNTGVIWSCYSTWREPSSIEFEYKKKLSAEKVKKLIGGVEKEVEQPVNVMEWWDDKDNIITAEETILNEKDTKHKLGRPPVIVVPVGSTPLVVGGDGKYDFVENWGESIFGGGRDVIDAKSKVLSIWMSLLVKSHKPSYFLKTPDGSKKLQDTPWGKGEVLPIPLDAEPIPVAPPDIANTAPQFFEIISQMEQRLYYPNIKYAQLWKGQELSGKMGAQLIGEADRVLNPILNALSQFYKMSLKRLGKQYLLSGDSMTVMGYDSKEREFLENISPEIFDCGYDMDIKFKDISPEREAENWAKATMARQSGLADDDTIREEVAQFRDPESIRKKLSSKEMEMLSPKIKLLRLIEDAEKSNRTYLIDGQEVREADILKREMETILQQEMQPPPQAKPPQSPQAPQMPQMGGM